VPAISNPTSGAPGRQRIWTEPARAAPEGLAGPAAAGDDAPEAGMLLFTVAALLGEMLADPAGATVPSPAVLFWMMALEAVLFWMAPLVAVPALVPAAVEELADAFPPSAVELLMEAPGSELVDPLTPDMVPDAVPVTCAQAGAAISVDRMARASRVVCM
jgi:hypothetical protein